MKAQRGMKGIVSYQRWSGHGEGGMTVSVEIRRPMEGDSYEATAEDKTQAHLDAAYVTAALEAYDRLQNDSTAEPTK